MRLERNQSPYILMNLVEGPAKSIPQWLKPIHLGPAIGTTKQAAEKPRMDGENSEKYPSGPKGQTHSIAFTARLKSCPDTNRLNFEFFRSL